MTEQNLSACLILSAIGGIMGVLATAILAYPDAQKVRGNPWSPCAQCCALLLSLFFQLGIAIATIAATWFGPVSIVVPTSSSAQLLFNMCMFGVILGLESFTKSMRVGAYVVVLAAILLPVVGPGVQQNQDILALLQQTRSIVWSTLLLASLVISTVGLVLSNMRRKQQQQEAPTTANDYNMFVFNLMAQISGAVVGTTVAKMFVLVEGAALGVCIAIWFVSSIILVYATVLQATTVVQGKFVPLSVGTKIAVNALTGIIIWEDFLVVTSWIGYVCVFLYLMLGNYLLCDVDVFGVQNQQYGTAKTLEKVKSVVLTDVQHLKTDSKESRDVEMQEIHKQEQAKQVTNNDQTDTVQAIKSNLTSEYGDWIPEEQETGSEGVLSSSTAEAEDYYPSGRNPSFGEKEYIAQRETPPPEAPQTERSVWRHAYNVRNTQQSQTGNAADVQQELDPSTASGVWRKAYHVKR